MTSFSLPFSLSYSFLAPPQSLILLLLIGLLVSRRWRALGMIVAGASGIFLYVLSTPLASVWLLERARLQWAPAPLPLGEAQAIVVLSADFRSSGTPGVPDRVGLLTLDRALEAARLHRSLGLPILVSGGVLSESGIPIADAMSAVLEEDFQTPVQWKERKSRTTFENATFSAPILKAAGITTVIVVTQDWDAPRALWCFEKAGVKAIAPPLPASPERPIGLLDFLPDFQGLQRSFYALHELLGLAYYRYRYG